MNDLLDEALTETFPASDPIAINIELESPGDGIAITPRTCHSLRDTLGRVRGSSDTEARRA